MPDYPYEEKAKLVVDKANKKRNNAACFEAGHVSSSLHYGDGFYDPAPPRFTNSRNTLS
jgi:hypothetical protein